MKFTESKKLFLAILIIYLTTFAELAQIESSIKLSLNAQKRLSRNNLTNSFNRKKNTLKTNKKPNQNCAILYKDCNYRGASRTVCEDESSYSFSWGNEVSSVRLGANTKMVVFTNSGFKGHALEITQDISCLANHGYNDKIDSHYFVGKNCAVLFEDCNYAGRTLKTCDNVMNLGDEWESNQLSSLILGAETKITLFQDKEFKGEKLEMNQSSKCLVHQNFNDKANSVQILDNAKYVDVMLIQNNKIEDPVKRAFYNFLIGTVEGMAGFDNSFYKCLPDYMTNKVKESHTKTDALDKSFQSWNSGLRSFLSASGAVVQGMCNFRDPIISFISNLLSAKKVYNKLARVSFLELGTAKNASNAGKNKVNLSASKRRLKALKVWRASHKQILKKVWNAIKDTAFKKWFKPLKEKITSFVKIVKNFFASETFKKIINFLTCIYKAGMGIASLISTITGLLSKVETIKTFAVDPVTAGIVAVDFVIGFVCNWRKFKAAVSYFISAWNNPNKNLKWNFYGKAVGNFLNGVGTAKTFTGLYADIKNQMAKPVR